MSIISVFDTETTGLKADKGDRIIEIAIVCYDLATRKKLLEFVKRINPEGKLIDPKAQLVHKIQQRELEGKPIFKEIEPSITKIFNKSALIVAHNFLFDGEFLLHEYNRIGKSLPDVNGFCTMNEGRWATSFGKLPNLGELCHACGVGYDTDAAHAALYDVLKTAECFFYGLDNGGYKIEGIE